MHTEWWPILSPLTVSREVIQEQRKDYPAYSQAPLLAWGMERVYRRTHDLDLLHVGLPKLEAFHNWYWRERDVRNLGLVRVGSYSGDVQHARYETYDSEVDLDDLKLTEHPTRNSGAWYGDVCIPVNTSYLLLSEASLARMASTVGDRAMAQQRRRMIKKGIAAMQKHMWDNDHGCFLSVHRDSLKRFQSRRSAGWSR